MPATDGSGKSRRTKSSWLRAPQVCAAATLGPEWPTLAQDRQAFGNAALRLRRGPVEAFARLANSCPSLLALVPAAVPLGFLSGRVLCGVYLPTLVAHRCLCVPITVWPWYVTTSSAQALNIAKVVYARRNPVALRRTRRAGRSADTKRMWDPTSCDADGACVSRLSGATPAHAAWTKKREEQRKRKGASRMCNESKATISTHVQCVLDGVQGSFAWMHVVICQRCVSNADHRVESSTAMRSQSRS